MAHDASDDPIEDEPKRDGDGAGEEAAPIEPAPLDEVDSSRYARKGRHLPHLEDESDYESDSVPLPKPVEEQGFFARLKARFRG